MWQSADPIIGKYLPMGEERNRKLPGMGGVFNSRTLSLYAYAALNPLMVIDPDGNANIVIDPGHGDRNMQNRVVDPGASATHGGIQYVEKDLALSFSQAIGGELQKLGHTVTYTRQGDVNLPTAQPLQWRVDVAGQAKPDLFISVHIDSATSPNATGLTVFANAKGQPFKTTIEQSITSTGVRTSPQRNLYLLRNQPTRPALLLEAGFITNQNDVKTITNAISGQSPLAQEIAAGIDRALPQPSPQAPSPPP